MNHPPMNIYDDIGGATAITQLIEVFYDKMSTAPETQSLWAMHNPELTEMKTRLHAYLSLWFGGPDDYRPRYGEPFMRRRHFAFAIGPTERDQWLWCMDAALDEVLPPTAVREKLRGAFHEMAEHFRNRDEVGTPQLGCQRDTHP